MEQIALREGNEQWNETIHELADELIGSLLIYFGYLDGIQTYKYIDKNYSY